MQMMNKNNRHLLLSLLLIAAVMLMLGPLHVAGMVRLCGSKLTTTIVQLCEHGVNGPSSSQLTERRSYQFGVARQCCRYRCSIDYLRTFCAQPDADSSETAVTDSASSFASSLQQFHLDAEPMKSNDVPVGDLFSSSSFSSTSSASFSLLCIPYNLLVCIVIFVTQ